MESSKKSMFHNTKLNIYYEYLRSMVKIFINYLALLIFCIMEKYLRTETEWPVLVHLMQPSLGHFLRSFTVHSMNCKCFVHLSWINHFFFFLIIVSSTAYVQNAKNVTSNVTWKEFFTLNTAISQKVGHSFYRRNL